MSTLISQNIMLIFFGIMTIIAARLGEQLFTGAEERSAEAIQAKEKADSLLDELKHSIIVLNLKHNVD